MAAANSKSSEQLAADLEKVCDALWNAEFLIVAVGPTFDEGMRNPFESDRCDPSLVSQPNRFMGFWGGVFNTCCDRNPHEGFNVISRWRDRFFCQDDMRKRGKKKAAEDETEFDKMARCLIYTGLIGNQFQRLGVPSEEVFDALGNITQWQCSRMPPCCVKATTAERGFRFVIDDATKEAMPVKYVQQRVSDKVLEVVQVHDSDDDELVAMIGGATKNPFEIKLPKEERQKRVLRRIEQPRVLRHHPSTQPGRERFPDLFTGFAVAAGAMPLPHFLPGLLMDDQAPRKLPPMPTTDEGEPVPLLPMLNPPGIMRCSHLQEHIFALDLKAREPSVGKFATVEPERYTKEREQYYTALNKMFLAENHTAMMKRSKYVTYNISMVIVAPGQSVVHESLRNKLFSVYSSTSQKHQVPVVSEKGEVVGHLHPKHAAALELRRQYLDEWTQGRRGWYYFSNQASRQTMHDPITDTDIDVVHLQFPADGEDALELPDGCRISIMCETVIDTHRMPAEGSAGRGAAAAASSNSSKDATTSSCRFVNSWQVVGDFQHGTFSDPEFKNKDNVEYVLIGREHHGVRVGVLKQAPTRVQYIRVQLPATTQSEQLGSGAVGDALGSAFVSHCRASVEKVVAQSGRGLAADSNANKKEKPPLPVPNHILCANCHDVARPFVLMSKPGMKDEGFCHALLAARTKQLKAWEKLMTESIKSDTSKSVVILELGGDRKVDAARSYSEKTFKTLKQSKCTFVRISSQDLETKGKKGGEEGNSVVLVMNPTQALVTLDNLLGERLRKGR